MFQLSDGPARSQLKKETMAYFENAGWDVRAQSDTRFDFRIEKRGIHAFVICVDEKIKNFVEPGSLIERIRTISHYITGSHGINYIAVFNFVFPGMSLEAVAAKGVLIVKYDELELIDKLVRFFDTVPTEATHRELRLIQGSRELCYSIANRFRQLGNRQAAIEWLERAIEGSPNLIWPYKRLSDLYRETGDLEAAEQVALEAFKVDPKSVPMMQVMHKIAEAKGNTEMLLEWVKKIKDVEKKTLNFESMVRRQNAQVQMFGREESAEPAPEVRVGTVTWRFFPRVLGPKKGKR